LGSAASWSRSQAAWAASKSPPVPSLGVIQASLVRAAGCRSVKSFVERTLR
jgi:hypothetical protein